MDRLRNCKELYKPILKETSRGRGPYVAHVCYRIFLQQFRYSHQHDHKQKCPIMNSFVSLAITLRTVLILSFSLCVGPSGLLL